MACSPDSRHFCSHGSSSHAALLLGQKVAALILFTRSDQDVPEPVPHVQRGFCQLEVQVVG